MKRGIARRPLRGAAGLLVLAWAGTVVGPAVLPYRVAYIRSGSMRPALPVGALAVVVAADGAAIEVGDVVTFPRPGGMVTHRVVEVGNGSEGRWLVTAGDANAARDGWRVPATGRLWRLAFSIPGAGYVVGYLVWPVAAVAGGVVVLAATIRAARRNGRRGPGRGSRPAASALCAAGLVAAVPAAAPVAPARAALAADGAAPTNLFSLAALGAPAALSASASGADVALTWSPGTNGSGYAVEAVANGASADCSSAAFASLGTAAGASYTDAGRSAPAGVYWCYRVTTTYASWTSVNGNPTVAARIGFVADSVTMANAGDTSGCSGSGAGTSGSAGTLDCGDQLTVTFNQAVDTVSGPAAGDTVCTDVLGVIRVGSTSSSGLCTALETLHVGTLTGGALGSNARYAATYAWSNANRTLTVTVGEKVSGLSFPTVGSSVWTLTPTALQSATGGLGICSSNAGGALCLPDTAAGTAF